MYRRDLQYLAYFELYDLVLAMGPSIGGKGFTFYMDNRARFLDPRTVPANLGVPFKQKEPFAVAHHLKRSEIESRLPTLIATIRRNGPMGRAIYEDAQKKLCYTVEGRLQAHDIEPHRCNATLNRLKWQLGLTSYTLWTRTEDPEFSGSHDRAKKELIFSRTKSGFLSSHVVAHEFAHAALVSEHTLHPSHGALFIRKYEEVLGLIGPLPLRRNFNTAVAPLDMGGRVMQAISGLHIVSAAETSVRHIAHSRIAAKRA